MLKKFLKGANPKEVISWAFYDFANSSYSLIIASFAFPIFYRDAIVGAKLGDFYWGLIVSIATLAGGILAPLLGAMADHDGRKKRKFVILVAAAVTSTALLYFAKPGAFLYASIVFIIGSICYQVSQTVYDSFLAKVSTPETIGRISGLAWGLGYLGGAIATIILFPLYGGGFEGDLEGNYRLSFLLTAGFFLVFSIPSFIYLKDSSFGPPLKLYHSVKAGLARILTTFKSIKSHKKVLTYLIGFYFLNDALVTVFAFIPIYARTTIGMSFKDIMILLLIVQVLGFPSTAFFGWLNDKKGPKKILLFTILVWAVNVGLIAIAESKTAFYIIAAITALVIGASQAVSRSWFSQIVPEEKRFEFFGFNAFTSKIAATLGPILFGTIASITGNQRLAILSLLPMFIISFVIFSKIKE